MKIYNETLRCEECNNNFYEKDNQIFIIKVEKYVFVEDKECRETKDHRYIQLCKECFDDSILKRVLIEENRDFR